MSKQNALLEVEFSPSQKAYLEIIALASRPDLQHNVMIGGKTPPHMVEENGHKDAKHQQLKLEIIAKHGVADEYLQPLYKEEERLSGRLEKVRKQIKDLERIKK